MKPIWTIALAAFLMAAPALAELAALGYVNIPGSIVEPLIALSIAAQLVEVLGSARDIEIEERPAEPTDDGEADDTTTT